MSYNRASDWDSTGAHNYFHLEQGQRYRGANGQWYAHDGWPIDESAPRFDRYPMEENWDSRGWNVSGRYPSIRMEPGRRYRVGGQSYAHDGWPIDDEPRSTAPANTPRHESTSRGGQARDAGRGRSPSPEDRYVEPRGPADEGRIPPGVGLPPRARYYDNDPDDYLRPCSCYPYEDDYNRGNSYRDNHYDDDYRAQRSSTADAYGPRTSTYQDDDYDRSNRSSYGRGDEYGREYLDDDRDYRNSYGRGDGYDRDYRDEHESYDDGGERRSSQRDDRYREEEDGDQYEDRGSRGYRTLSIYLVRGF